MKTRIFLLLIPILMLSANEPKLVKTKITKGVTANLPKGFVAMSDNDIAQKYPSTKKPLAMFTSLDRTVDFGLNVSKSSWSGSNMEVLKKVYKATILELYSNVVFLNEGIEKISNRDFVFFEFTSEADQTKKYTYLQYTIIGNRLYIFNFTVGAEFKDKWQGTAGNIMRSVIINPKKLKEVVEEYQPVHKGKRPVQVLKDQNTKEKK
jgi:hypothetical protein